MKIKRVFISLALILGYFLIPTNSLAATLGCKSLPGQWVGSIMQGKYAGQLVTININKVVDRGSKRFYSVEGTISWPNHHDINLFPSAGVGSWCRQRDNNISSLLIQGIANQSAGQFMTISFNSISNSENPQVMTSAKDHGFVIDGRDSGEITLHKS